MDLSLWLDLGAIAIIVASVIISVRRGVVKSLYKILSVVLTIVAVIVFSGPAVKLMSSLGFDRYTNDMVTTAIVGNEADEVNEIKDIDDLPVYFNNAVEDVAETAIVPIVCDVVNKLVAAIAIYILTKLVLFILFLVIQGMFKLPVLKTANKLLGFAAGVISSVVILYLVCGIASLNVSNSTEFRNVVDKTYVVKYFYDNNLLMNLFLINN